MLKLDKMHKGHKKGETYPVQCMLCFIEEAQSAHFVHLRMVLFGHQAVKVAGHDHRGRQHPGDHYDSKHNCSFTVGVHARGKELPHSFELELGSPALNDKSFLGIPS